MASYSQSSRARYKHHLVKQLLTHSALSKAELSFSSLDHFAQVAGLETSELMPLIRHDLDLYEDVEFFNRNTGKVRNLSIPNPKLMHIQKTILSGMRVNWERNAVGHIPHAYISHRSILTASRIHTNTQSGFKLDIKDFFPSITASLIESSWYWKKLDMLSRHEAELVRAIIALSTRQGNDCSADSAYLPQGAPTSGIMSNIAARRIDLAMSRVARRFDMRVTRYADDIFFSTDVDIERISLELALEQAQGAIQNLGFVINKHKTRILTPGSRMEVLGIMLGGETPRLSRTKRRKIESEIRGIVKFGLLSHALERHRNPDALYQSLRGYLAFAYPLEKEWASRQIALLEQAVKEIRYDA